jgi:hypothetical protein
MPETIELHARDAFYAAALVGLRALDARERTPRRFGPDAEARWEQFKGSLGPGDRLDLLLRDGASTWGVAFSPAEAFGLFGLSEDEPFGPDWRGIPDEQARRLLTTDAPIDLASAARALGIAPASFPLPDLSSSVRVIAAGGAAVLALAERFAANPGWSWADQVVVVATSAAHRQLAGLAAVLLGSRERARVLRPAADPRAILAEARFAAPDVAAISPDAEPDCAAFAQRAVGAR